MCEVIGLYIHIPFCNSKCPYCDFYSKKACNEDFDCYCTELCKKIEYWGMQNKKKVATVYFGGGTPSIIGAKRLCLLLNKIKSNFSLVDNAEITVEINPDTGKTIDFGLLYNCGFNRVSIGLQSAVDDELKALGRIHTANEAKITVNRAKSVGFNNISLDLMIGIPNQTLDTLKKSIDFCKDCGVTHISSYILKIEENTPFYNMQENLNLADDDLQAEMYLSTVERLSKLGYNQYEISNFALEGFESKHNINYWSCNEYIGIGASAHSFFNGKRFYYGRSLSDFYNNKIISDGYGGGEEEYIMLSLRLKSGLKFSEYKRKFNKEFPEYKIERIKKYEKLRYVVLENDRVYFTPSGYLVSNTIISDII